MNADAPNNTGKESKARCMTGNVLHRNVQPRENMGTLQYKDPAFFPKASHKTSFLRKQGQFRSNRNSHPTDIPGT